MKTYKVKRYLVSGNDQNGRHISAVLPAFKRSHAARRFQRDNAAKRVYVMKVHVSKECACVGEESYWLGA